MNFSNVIRFWFEEIEPKQWWVKDAALDAELRTRFEAVHRAASRGELFAWRATAEGRLAEIVVLDQFSRNMYRNMPEAFAFDLPALILAQEAVACGADRALPPPQRVFIYMPYTHSESLLIHEQAVKLFNQPGLNLNYEYELKHKRIIERFGRYPHRNVILGRESTARELEFLKQPDSSF